MSSITQKLEQILDEQLETLPVEQINELVHLILLDEKECEQKFSKNKILNEKYFSKNKEKIFVLKSEEPRIFGLKEEPETEESSSDIKMSSKHSVNKASSSSNNRRFIRKKEYGNFPCRIIKIYLILIVIIVVVLLILILLKLIVFLTSIKEKR
ncbi:hypothetical protein Hanom_Chr04g00306511 [Helianthus anomalus]